MNKKNSFCNNKHKKIGRFMEASLLCLLKEEKDYGYSIVERLSEFGLNEDAINISIVYRNLKKMENRNLVTCSWEESEQGPDRRIYNITSKGKTELENWITLLKDRKIRITSIIDKHENILEI